MQVRFANRQDEPNIRAFVESVYAENGAPFELDGPDSDLRNIEANYFGKEGLFIVAEEDKKIFGIAAARKKSENVLELMRLLLASELLDGETASEMIDIIVNFAPRLLYDKIVDGRPLFETKTKDEFVDVLKNAGFEEDSENLSLAVTADF